MVALAEVCKGKTLISFAVGAPFGTIKAWMGATHFQMRRLTKVASEMALHVLAYNMKRVMQILGSADWWPPCGPEARLGAPKSIRADDHRDVIRARGARLPKIRRADPSNPRRHRRVSNRGAKRARSHTAWSNTDEKSPHYEPRG